MAEKPPQWNDWIMRTRRALPKRGYAVPPKNASFCFHELGAAFLPMKEADLIDAMEEVFHDDPKVASVAGRIRAILAQGKAGRTWSNRTAKTAWKLHVRDSGLKPHDDGMAALEFSLHLAFWDGTDGRDDPNVPIEDVDEEVNEE